MQTDPYALGLCEYHLERKGVAVPAARIVNDEPMCARCFAGAAIFAFEKIGDTDGDLESGDRRRAYLAKNQEAKERKRLRDALWRARQKQSLREKSRFTAVPPPREPYENAPVAAPCAAFGG